MIKTNLSCALLFCVMGCFIALPAGADPGSAYRLTVKPEPFRLAVTVPIPEPLPDKPYAALIHDAAIAASLEPALVHAVIAVESAYNPAARSHKGAIGLMQVMPGTAIRYGVKDPARSPKDNLKAGTLYLKDLMRQFSNRLELVLAAYNAGENAVLRHGGKVPPYRETRRYVPAVLAKYRELQEPLPEAQAGPRFFEYMSGTRLQSGMD